MRSCGRATAGPRESVHARNRAGGHRVGGRWRRCLEAGRGRRAAQARGRIRREGQHGPRRKPSGVTPSVILDLPPWAASTGPWSQRTMTVSGKPVWRFIDSARHLLLVRVGDQVDSAARETALPLSTRGTRSSRELARARRSGRQLSRVRRPAGQRRPSGHRPRRPLRAPTRAAMSQWSRRRVPPAAPASARIPPPMVLGGRFQVGCNWLIARCARQAHQEQRCRRSHRAGHLACRERSFVGHRLGRTRAFSCSPSASDCKPHRCLPQ
jgi:hypothetical protein